MKKKMLLLFLLPLVLTGCEKKPEVVENYEIEAGNELNTDVSTYATFDENTDSSKYEVNFDGVDTTKIGTYEAKVINTEKGKEYPFQITVVDTTYPEADLKDSYTITQPGTFTASDYIENIEDNTDTTTGFLSFDKREDLKVMTDEEVKNDAKSGTENQNFTDEMTFEETKEILEEGIYDTKIAIKDSAGNMKVFDYTFYIDGTGIDLPEHEDETVHINNANGDFVPDLDDYSFSDNFDDGWKIVDETTVDCELVEDYFNEDNKYVEEVKIIIHSKDRAGNESERTWMYTVINDYDYMKELSKYINTGSSNSNTNSDSVNSASTEQTTTQTSSDGFDRAKAEEAFALVNQKRSENGVGQLAWNDTLYNFACTRAQEIVQNFSHVRPNGIQVNTSIHELGFPGCGENIGRYGNSANEIVTSWMNSDGHRGNMLDGDWTYGALACYKSNGKYYWVNLFGM